MVGVPKNDKYRKEIQPFVDAVDKAYKALQIAPELSVACFDNLLAAVNPIGPLFTAVHNFIKFSTNDDLAEVALEKFLELRSKGVSHRIYELHDGFMSRMLRASLPSASKKSTTTKEKKVRDPFSCRGIRLIDFLAWRRFNNLCSCCQIFSEVIYSCSR